MEEIWYDCITECTDTEGSVKTADSTKQYHCQMTLFDRKIDFCHTSLCKKETLYEFPFQRKQFGYPPFFPNEEHPEYVRLRNDFDSFPFTEVKDKYESWLKLEQKYNVCTWHKEERRIPYEFMCELSPGIKGVGGSLMGVFQIFIQKVFKDMWINIVPQTENKIHKLKKPKLDNETVKKENKTKTKKPNKKKLKKTKPDNEEGTKNKVKTP